jgi:TolB protein
MKKTLLPCLLFFAHTAFSQAPQKVESFIETMNIATKERKVVYQEQRHIEAPNWSPDGTYLIVNSNGLLYKLPLQSPRLEEIPTGFANKCNNDHGISPDGKWLAISHNDTADSRGSTISVVPIAGGLPKIITTKTPSYWHGWSPDGQLLAYCAERNGNYDVYTIPAAGGGAEKRLTDNPGLDDGPEYAPDGKYIYFNSFRNGGMHIWRMKPDGSGQEQVTSGTSSDWFAHPSPDGQWLLYISYIQDQGQQHPFGKEVQLRLYNLKTGAITNLTEVFFGGQGTINVPSWSPDSKQVAFVRYKVSAN